MALEYAQNGATIGLAARRESALSSIADDIRKKGGIPVIYTLDVTDYDACKRAADDFIAETGGIDILIANAGISGTDGISSGDISKINVIVDTNIHGVLNIIFPFLEQFRKQKSGRIAIISSVAGFRALPGRSGYSASKVAVRFLADGWRAVLARDGISLITICPGFIRTPLTDKNSYPMPFLMDADVAAQKMAAAIEARKPLYVFPWQWRLVVPLMKLLPRWLVDWSFSLGGR